MSKPNEDRDVYYIPPNFLTSGRLFGGMIRARNAIEACVLVLLTGVPIMLCFDYQAQTVQGIVGPAIEVRPVESMNNHGKKKTENNP